MADVTLEVLMRKKITSLAERRRALGLTQRAAAKKIGINEQAYGVYENLKKWPSPKLQDKICDALGLNANEVFTFDLQQLSGFATFKRTATVDAMDAIKAFASLDDMPLLTSGDVSDQQVLERDTKEKIEEALSILEGRERHVIQMYFGFEPYRHDKTLREIGEVLDVTVERARQIKEKALRRLRHPANGKALLYLLDYIEPPEQEDPLTDPES